MDELESIVGTGQEASGYTVGGVAPAAVALPQSVAQAAEVLRLARARGWSVFPYGGGGLIDLGHPPAKVDLVLSTAGLNKVVDYQPDDQTVTVQAGVTLAELDRVLSERNQFLPLNPPLPEQATVGGMVATASTGPWCAGYGTPRDWLIGCRVLDALGEEVRGGGQVVKNVAGYDLPKLYTGSFGTLGLLTELTFKVSPRPAVAGFVRIDLGSSHAHEALTGAILASDLEPAALELLHRSAWKSLGGPDPERSWSILVQFWHTEPGVRWQVGRLAVLAGQHDGWFTELPAQQGETLLNSLRDAPAGKPFVARLGVVSSDAAALAEKVVALDPGLVVFGHSTLAQLFVCADSADRELAVRLRALATDAGASCIFQQLPTDIRGTINPWGLPPVGFGLMKRIKEALDPDRIFSPGRFVGGPQP